MHAGSVPWAEGIRGPATSATPSQRWGRASLGGAGRVRGGEAGPAVRVGPRARTTPSSPTTRTPSATTAGAAPSFRLPVYAVPTSPRPGTSGAQGATGLAGPTPRVSRRPRLYLSSPSSITGPVSPLTIWSPARGRGGRLRACGDPGV